MAVVIWVSNLNSSIDFYGKLFGTDQFYLSDGFASVKAGNNEVLLHLLPEQFHGQASLGEENPIKPVFEVLEISDFAEQLLRGVSEYEDWRYADLLDVDGHVIQIRQRISG